MLYFIHRHVVVYRGTKSVVGTNPLSPEINVKSVCVLKSLLHYPDVYLVRITSLMDRVLYMSVGSVYV